MSITDEELAEWRKAAEDAQADWDDDAFNGQASGERTDLWDPATVELPVATVLRLLDTLSQLRAQAAWRPIESAPRDGTPVLLFGNHKGDEHLTPGCIVGAWNVMTDEGGWRAYGDFTPRAWMPLPPPPQNPRKDPPATSDP